MTALKVILVVVLWGAWVRVYVYAWSRFGE